jgi:hypothetical protein
MSRDQRKVLESAIEAHLTRRVKALRGRAPKMQYVRGWPDRLVALPGALFFVETKRPKGGRYEPLQQYIHRKLRDMGHTVLILNTKAKVDDVFDTLQACGTNAIVLRRTMAVLAQRYYDI